jgi:hypothetical protein
MDRYHLCVAWNWEYDADFVALLQKAFAHRDLALLQITPANAAACCAALRNGHIAFGALLDRASDTAPQFLPLVAWARQHDVLSANPYYSARRAWDKATMHLDFIAAGLPVPYAIILPSFDEQPEIDAPDLGPLGQSFSIKPACQGGGVGVVNAAASMEEVHAARREYPDEKYLLQAQVRPMQLDSGQAWFRVIYCFDEVYPCWWDVHTHVYRPLHRTAQTQRAFDGLRELAVQIAAVCGLQLFSTEVALADGEEFVIVDYVNDPLDLRLQSQAVDGVPDAIVGAIADRLAEVAGANYFPI